MTRSKELQRIENALENADPAELRWAAYECKERLRFVTKKQGGARWRRLLGRIELALRQAGLDTSGTPFLPSVIVARQRSERQQPGKATGEVVCQMHLPSLDLILAARFGQRQMSRLRRFVEDSLPGTETASDGASFTVSAIVRHRGNQGVRRVVLCRWQAGQNVNSALERAAERWEALRQK